MSILKEFFSLSLFFFALKLFRLRVTAICRRMGERCGERIKKRMRKTPKEFESQQTEMNEKRSRGATE